MGNWKVETGNWKLLESLKASAESGGKRRKQPSGIFYFLFLAGPPA
jgi:hypothetical protein